MFGKVKRMLASELMYAKGIRLEDAMSFLDGVLTEICASQPRAN
jgi:RNA polymerase-interacting CarD/CdnL/TRCF family regulator